MGDHYQLEEGLALQLDFNKIDSIGEKKQQVIPVAVQNIDTTPEERNSYVVNDDEILQLAK